MFCTVIRYNNLGEKSMLEMGLQQVILGVVYHLIRQNNPYV